MIASKNKLDISWRGHSSESITDRFSIFQDKKNKLALIKRDNANVKKMLCRNMTMQGSCGYGDKCLFAHNLEEQTIDDYRKDSYGILLSKKRLDNYDMQKNYTLYRSLLDLTKICEQCEKGKCTGGYNCKYGVCAKEYQVCVRDLNHGDCSHGCGFVHLTERGLKPLYGTSTEIKNQLINGTLLSSEFFKKLEPIENSDIGSVSDVSTESEKNELIDECEKSIFSK